MNVFSASSQSISSLKSTYCQIRLSTHSENLYIACSVFIIMCRMEDAVNFWPCDFYDQQDGTIMTTFVTETKTD